jgi:DNA-binding transcriptional ArsR family regulator
MSNLNSFKKAAALFGEPARAAMIWELFDGKPVSAGDLAIAANITPQSASSHLKKLVEAGILSVQKQGKHKYFVYANPEIAVAVETLGNIFLPLKNLTLLNGKCERHAAVMITWRDWPGYR